MHNSIPITRLIGFLFLIVGLWFSTIIITEVYWDFKPLSAITEWSNKEYIILSFTLSLLFIGQGLVFLKNWARLTGVILSILSILFSCVSINSISTTAGFIAMLALIGLLVCIIFILLHHSIRQECVMPSDDLIEF